MTTTSTIHTTDASVRLDWDSFEGALCRLTAAHNAEANKFGLDGTDIIVTVIVGGVPYTTRVYQALFGLEHTLDKLALQRIEADDEGMFFVIVASPYGNGIERGSEFPEKEAKVHQHIYSALGGQIDFFPFAPVITYGA